MKRILGFILLASAMPAFFSCTREEIAFPVQEKGNLIITATREADGPETKTERVNGKTYWSVGDKISVFYGSGTDGGAEFTSTNTEPVAAADFSGILNAVTGSEEGGTTSQKYFWGVYPYSKDNSLTLSGTSNYLTTVVKNIQYGMADSYSPGQNIWIGRDTGLELSFKSLLSGLKFTFTRDDIIRVTIQGNNGEYIAGKVNVTMDSGVPVVSGVVEGKKSVSLMPQSGRTFQKGVVYRALFLPANFTKGLTVTFYTTDGSVGRRTFKANNYERNAPKNAANADSDATWDAATEYVEMGPGIFWATKNVGASSPEEYGDYFAWGETEPKGAYSDDNYKWYTSGSLTKYNDDESRGAVDYILNLQAEDDAASANLGRGWKTPSLEDWKWLRSNCEWSWTGNYEGTGVKGFIVTSKIEGYTSNSIFLPAAGAYSGDNQGMDGTHCMYWSSKRRSISDGGNTSYVQSIDFLYGQNPFQYMGYPRSLGLSVRPIYRETTPVTGVNLSQSSFNLDPGSTQTLTATVLPSSATDPAVVWFSSDENVASVSQDGVVTGVHAGTATITGATADGGFTATCEVTVGHQINGYDFVEMGVTSKDGKVLKWSPYNVFTIDTDDMKQAAYGDYIAWGELGPYYTSLNPVTWETGIDYGYNFSSYSFLLYGFTSTAGISKYQIEDGNTDALWYYNGQFAGDNKTVLEAVDDAASYNFGGTWRMPTKDEWEQLLDTNKFIWTWITEEFAGGEVSGYIVTSRVPGYQGNQLFLPAAGAYIDDIHLNPDHLGAYWSSSIGGTTEAAWYLAFSDPGESDTTMKMEGGQRSMGLSIRPVSE